MWHQCWRDAKRRTDVSGHDWSILRFHSSRELPSSFAMSQYQFPTTPSNSTHSSATSHSGMLVYHLLICTGNLCWSAQLRTRKPQSQKQLELVGSLLPRIKWLKMNDMFEQISKNQRNNPSVCLPISSESDAADWKSSSSLCAQNSMPLKKNALQ